MGPAAFKAVDGSLARLVVGSIPIHSRRGEAETESAKGGRSTIYSLLLREKQPTARPAGRTLERQPAPRIEALSMSMILGLTTVSGETIEQLLACPLCCPRTTGMVPAKGWRLISTRRDTGSISCPPAAPGTANRPGATCLKAGNTSARSPCATADLMGLRPHLRASFPRFKHAANIA